jgi:hypothetical protein
MARRRIMSCGSRVARYGLWTGSAFCYRVTISLCEVKLAVQETRTYCAVGDSLQALGDPQRRSRTTGWLDVIRRKAE